MDRRMVPLRTRPTCPGQIIALEPVRGVMARSTQLSYRAEDEPLVLMAVIPGVPISALLAGRDAEDAVHVGEGVRRTWVAQTERRRPQSMLPGCAEGRRTLRRS